MKQMFKKLFLLAVLTIFPAIEAQALTAGCSAPPPSYGVVWSPSQWVTCLSSFQANLGYVPLNSAGGSMSGELFVAPSITSNAPLNFPLGVAPTSPTNGDLWFTSSGLFYRAGGVSVGPLAGTTSQTFINPTFTGTATFPDGTTWTSAVITPGTAPWASLTSTGTTILGGASAAEGLRVYPIASAVNRWSMSGNTTGNSPVLIADGSNTDISGTYYTKGTGGHSFYTGAAGGGSTSGGVLQVAILNTSSASRYVTITGSNGGTPAINTSAGALQLGSAASAGLNVTGGTNQLTITGGTAPAINTSAGNLAIGSAGATTSLSDAAVQLSNAGYHSCDSLGTSGAGTITCGGAPSGYITYNDDITTNTAAATGNLYCMNTASGALTLTLPASPSNGAYVAFSDCGGNFGANALTIARNGSNIMYSAGNMTVSTPYAGGVLRYSNGRTSWILSPL